MLYLRGALFVWLSALCAAMPTAASARASQDPTVPRIARIQNDVRDVLPTAQASVATPTITVSTGSGITPPSPNETTIVQGFTSTRTVPSTTITQTFTTTPSPSIIQTVTSATTVITETVETVLQPPAASGSPQATEAAESDNGAGSSFVGRGSTSTRLAWTFALGVFLASYL